MTLRGDMCPTCFSSIKATGNIEYSEVRKTPAGIVLVISAKFCRRECLSTWLHNEAIAARDVVEIRVPERT